GRPSRSDRGRLQASQRRPHREDGVLRSVRHVGGRQRHPHARQDAGGQRAPGQERRSRDARLRRDGARQDPHVRGARRARAGRPSRSDRGRLQASQRRPHREDGVLRSVRHVGGRQRHPHARQDAGGQRAPGQERRSRDARLRRDGARQDPHVRGARRARAGGPGQRAAGAQRRDPGAARGGRVTGGDPRPRGSIADTVQATDGFLRHAGRDFLVVLYTAFRSLKLYPVENAQVQKALDDLAQTTQHLLDVEKELELRLQGEFIFVNSTRLRLDLDNYASFSHILGVLRQCGVGAVRIDEGVERKQLQIFVSLLLSYAAKEATPNKIFELSQKLSDAGVTHVGVDPPLETDEEAEDEERQKEAAKRTYARSVAVTKEVINSIRMGRTANVKKVKR